MRRALVTALFLGACATAPGAKKLGPAPIEYWPLDGRATYQFTATGFGGTSRKTVRVRPLGDGWFRMGPGQRLRHDADGLFDGERYLIRRPLRVGAKWSGVPRPGVIERFMVVRVDASCRPAHPMATRCLVIEARQKVGAQTLLTRWWYGHRVGLLRVEVFIQQVSGALKLQTRLERVKD